MTTLEESTEAMNALRFIALSTSVHVDAVQCAFENTRRAIVKMTNEEEEMSYLEKKLADLLERQGRVHAIKGIVSRAQTERQKGLSMLREDEARRAADQRSRKKIIQSSTAAATNSNVRGARRTQGGSRSPSSPMPAAAAGAGGGAVPNVQDIDPSQLTAYALRAISADDYEGNESSAPYTQSNVETEYEHQTNDGAAEEQVPIDSQVDMLRYKMRMLEQSSVKSKLVKLESKKQKARDVDGVAITSKYIDNFRFDDHVEDLWEDGVTQGAGCSASTVDYSDYEGQTQAAVDHTNVDLLVARACQRLTGRYEDGFDALQGTHLTEQDEAEQVFGCMLYATRLETPANDEVSAVHTLQRMGSQTLGDYYRQKCKAATTCAPIDKRCFGVSDSVLGPFEHNALPNDWRMANQLNGVPPAETLLPPVRHILTSRFSSANLKEMKALESLRVDIQRYAVRAMLNPTELVPRALPARSSARDETAVAARLALYDNAPASQQHAWVTLAAAVPT